MNDCEYPVCEHGRQVLGDQRPAVQMVAGDTVLAPSVPLSGGRSLLGACPFVWACVEMRGAIPQVLSTLFRLAGHWPSGTPTLDYLAFFLFGFRHQTWVLMLEKAL